MKLCRDIHPKAFCVSSSSTVSIYVNGNDGQESRLERIRGHGNFMWVMVWCFYETFCCRRTVVDSSTYSTDDIAFSKILFDWYDVGIHERELMSCFFILFFWYSFEKMESGRKTQLKLTTKIKLHTSYRVLYVVPLLQWNSSDWLHS